MLFVHAQGIGYVNDDNQGIVPVIEEAEILPKAKIFKDMLIYYSCHEGGFIIVRTTHTGTTVTYQKETFYAAPDVIDFEIGENRFQEPILAWMTDTHICYIKLLQIGPVLRVPLQRTPDAHVRHLLHRDQYFYVTEELKTGFFVLHVYAPDWRWFGSFHLHDMHVHAPMFIGKDLYYANRTSLVRMDTTSKKKRVVLPAECRFFTFTPNHLFLYIDDEAQLHTYQWNDDDTGCAQYETLTLLHTTPCVSKNAQYFTDITFGQDYRHELSDITKCHVYTYFTDQMTSNEEWYCNVLCEAARKLYMETPEQISHSLYRTLSLSHLRPNQRTVYIGKDVYHLLHTPRYLFKHPDNYQTMTLDMNSLFHKSSEKESKETNDFIERTGMNIMPNHAFSGRLHVILPKHAKGWHHNIESVPKNTCEVIYIVCTNVNTFGGSFFYYRHPVSHKIHGVPDIHATMKFFLLNSNHDNPLWHAIGSFTATRLSIGFSKLADMEAHLKSLPG